MSTLALVMIARNEARCIERALTSVRPWVDDFAAARNAALALTDCDWRLVLDADEWLVEGGAVLATLRKDEPRFVGAVEVRNRFEQAGGIAIASSWLSRVLPRGVAYAGRIHEQPVHRHPVRRLPVRLDHDGYLGAPMRAKGDRNRRLLEASVAEAPHDAYLLYQLGKDHEVHGRHREACDCYSGALAHCDERAPYRHDLVVRSLFVLKQAGRLEEAIRLAEAEMPHWPQSPDYYFALGDVLLSHATERPHEAEALLPMIESCWLRCLELGDSSVLEGAVHGRGSHLAAHNLVVFYDSLGQNGKADAYRARSAPSAPPAATSTP
jgi:tetratricopeptide (TPR) repeat protein